MLKQFIRLILVILCVSFSTHFSSAQSLINAEEYTVYSDLIRGIYGDDTTSHLAIVKTTRAHFIEDDNTYVIKKLSPLDSEMVRNFNERNKLFAEIDNQFNLKTKISLIGDEIKEIFKPSQSVAESVEEKQWEEFRNKYQTFSLLTLSRVSFNKKRNQALVEFGSQSGFLAGEGRYYLLVKNREGWKIKRKVQAWIS